MKFGDPEPPENFGKIKFGLAANIYIELLTMICELCEPTEIYIRQELKICGMAHY